MKEKKKIKKEKKKNKQKKKQHISSQYFHSRELRHTLVLKFNIWTLEEHRD